MKIKSTKDLQNKKIAVLGAGIEGMSSAKYLASHGANVTVLDKKPISQLDKTIREIGEIRVIGGDDYLGNLSGYDLIVRSPGVKPSILRKAKSEKREENITSQTKLFFDLCPCKIIGVTGTKGKGTTSALIYEMLKKSGQDAYLGGNIGQPPFEFLDKLTPQSIVVLELSSFQLIDLQKSPHIAVMLMTTVEHLDYHKDEKEYVEAKRNLLRFQTEKDFTVVNRDYPGSNESDIYTEGQVFRVSREREIDGGCFVKDKQ